MEEKPRTTPYPLRMPDDLRALLEESAKAGARSLHAEIVARLQTSLSQPTGSAGRDEAHSLSQTVRELESLQRLGSLNYEIQRATMRVEMLRPQADQAWRRLQEVLQSGTAAEQAEASAVCARLQEEMQHCLHSIHDVEKEISSIHLERKASGLKELRDVQPVYASVRGQWMDTGVVTHNTAPKKPGKKAADH